MGTIWFAGWVAMAGDCVGGVPGPEPSAELEPQPAKRATAQSRDATPSKTGRAWPSRCLDHLVQNVDERPLIIDSTPRAPRSIAAFLALPRGVRSLLVHVSVAPCCWCHCPSWILEYKSMEERVLEETDSRRAGVRGRLKRYEHGIVLPVGGSYALRVRPRPRARERQVGDGCPVTQTQTRAVSRAPSNGLCY